MQTFCTAQRKEVSVLYCVLLLFRNGRKDFRLTFVAHLIYFHVHQMLTHVILLYAVKTFLTSKKCLLEVYCYAKIIVLCLLE